MRCLIHISTLDDCTDDGRADLVTLDTVLVYPYDLEPCAIFGEEIEIPSFIMPEVVVIAYYKEFYVGFCNQHIMQEFRWRELAKLVGKGDDYHVVDTLGFE